MFWLIFWKVLNFHSKRRLGHFSCPAHRSLERGWGDQKSCQHPKCAQEKAEARAPFWNGRRVVNSPEALTD